MTNFLSTKMTLIITVLALTFSAGVGGTLLAEEINTNWMGNDELSDVEAIVVQLVADINLLTDQIDVLNAEIDDLETDNTALLAQVTALETLRDQLQAELVIANNDLLQFKIDICTVIDTLPSNQRSKYDEWCGVYGEGLPPELGEYLEGTYMATVYAVDYNNYSDELYVTVVIVVDVDGWITDVTFDAFMDGDVSKDDYTYLGWFPEGTWSDQSDAIEAALISTQSWDVGDDIDGISGASINFSMNGMELAFNNALIGAVAP